MRGLLLAVLAMCVACDKQPTQTTLAKTVYRLDANHYLGDAVEQGSLTVWPVFADKPADIGEFLTLAEAQKRGLATVREQKAAEVTTLTIENKGTLPILICAGSLVKGGQQDRQIAQDFVIQAKTTVPVGAFCVEQSRWNGEMAFSPAGMATAEVRKAAQYDKDQGKVWKEVAVDRNNAIEVTALQALMVQSQQLESDLRALPDQPKVMRASTVATLSDIENAIAAIDFQLNESGVQMTPDERELFWRERVRLMKSLVRLRYAQAQRTAF